MIRIDRRLRDEGLEARMLLQIHDELVFEAPAEEIPGLAELVRREMTAALDLKVPLKVDLAPGPTGWTSSRYRSRLPPDSGGGYRSPHSRGALRPASPPGRRRRIAVDPRR